MEILASPDEANRRRLELALGLRWIRPHLRIAFGWSGDLWRAAWVLDEVVIWRKPREIRVAALEDLIREADPSMGELLGAVLEEREPG